MKCAQCGHVNDLDAEFCESCGSPLNKTCPQCGSPVKPGAAFCKKCGARLSAPISILENTQQASSPRVTAATGPRRKTQAATQSLQGERKLVTILFTDIAGSTSLAESMDPEEWKEVVAGSHERVSQAVYRYGGTVAQLLGDGVLAFFGAPVSHEDDAVRALRAALDIQASLIDYRRQLAGLVDDFQMRMGIHTGIVVAGEVGDDQHMEYLAVGDAVNLAARLQSAAQPGGVLISADTASLVRASFDLRSLGDLTIKGKREPVQAFEVLKGKIGQESPRGFEELSSPLVGRSEEYGRLQEALAELTLGRGQVVAILGEAGIGKSRLVEEACRSLAGNPERIHWIEGRALSYGQNLAFWTITQLLYSDLELPEGDSEIRIRAALKKRVAELFGEQANEVLPYLLHLAGARLEGEQARQIDNLDGETLRHQVLQVIYSYFERLARDKPLVAVFDDLHWADPSSLEALEGLLALTDQTPILLLLVTRLERDLPWWRIKIKAETDFAHRYAEILLKPLNGDEQNQLVDNLLMLSELPEVVRGQILERAEGNPFYLEEIVRALIDQRLIYFEGGAWHVHGDLQEISLPATLQGILQARIDRLPEEARRSLQLAAVIGKSFLYRLLKEVSGSDPELDQYLTQLQRLDLIREKGRQPELEYTFKHSLTQEAAYQSLLVERRQAFHQRVGEALENLYADRQDQYLGLLAHHFAASGDQHKAVNYLVKAGDQARLSDEHTEAIGYYQRALEILADLKDEDRAAQVWLKLGLIYNTNFQFEDSHLAYETAFRLQQKVLASAPTNSGAMLPVLRIGISYHFMSLDPGLTGLYEDVIVILRLFVGLARMNEELDVIPGVARSWQVLDGGRRYIFHLRDDFTWSDGTPVTATDFEWTWKRNLDPATGSTSASLLFDVVGAREFNLGIDPNPDHVGIHARDNFTLEVLLAEPVAYFPFIVTMPVTFPIPRSAVERYGRDWWRPGHILSNGPYQLVEFDAQHKCAVERRAGYLALAGGNTRRIEWIIIDDHESRLQAYLEGRLDLTELPTFLIPEGFPSQETLPSPALQVASFLFNPAKPPLDNPRVRKALVHALDRRSIYEPYNRKIAQGGLVPEGMPGHSPDIGLRYNRELSLRYLAEAGYPGGRNFPRLTLIGPTRFIQHFAEQYAKQWRENLGIEVDFSASDPLSPQESRKQQLQGSIIFYGWVADYPDPDNFLRLSEMVSVLKLMGWEDPTYDELVIKASRATDRGRRMEMYRQADRILVNEQTLVLPVTYGTSFPLKFLLKPWVKNFKPTLLGGLLNQDIFVEEH